MTDEANAPLSDAEFAALQLRVEDERRKRELAVAAKQEATLAPIRELIHGDTLAEIFGSLQQFATDPAVVEQRNWYIAIVALTNAIDQARKQIPDVDLTTTVS